MEIVNTWRISLNTYKEETACKASVMVILWPLRNLSVKTVLIFFGSR